MRPSQMLRSGGGGDTPLGKYGQYGSLSLAIVPVPLRRSCAVFWPRGRGCAIARPGGVSGFNLVANAFPI